MHHNQSHPPCPITPPPCCAHSKWLCIDSLTSWYEQGTIASACAAWPPWHACGAARISPPDQSKWLCMDSLTSWSNMPGGSLMVWPCAVMSVAGAGASSMGVLSMLASTWKENAQHNRFRACAETCLRGRAAWCCCHQGDASLVCSAVRVPQQYTCLRFSPSVRKPAGCRDSIIWRDPSTYTV